MRLDHNFFFTPRVKVDGNYRLQDIQLSAFAASRLWRDKLFFEMLMERPRALRSKERR